MFRGIHTITIDTKGRFAIPSRYRLLLENQPDKGALVVTIDTKEKCLLIYTTAEWKIIETNLQKLPSFNETARRIQRLLMGHATDIELDAQGRVLLPGVLRNYAQLDKDLVIIGQGNKFELWNKELWESKREQWLAEEAANTEDIPEEMKTFSL